MTLYEMITLAIALSMDAFAVALCKGACLSELKDRGESLAVAVTFGFYQALMPLIGWFFGSRFKEYIESVDHFIAFGLLGFIGIKLVYEAWKSRGEELVCTPLHFMELMLLGIATSIDALAAGIALAVLDLNIWLAILLIGCITLALSFIGFKLGKRYGIKLQSKAQLVGGLALVIIGTKILIEHLTA
ncbi:MAG: manganese efflux pump MntP family protein [Christensenellales bacterium]|jgi:putative Mn2+ efflux pump MntP|nr:manganese efflux pump [Clostridiales bacterium]